jgi:hypothetical protein
VAAARRSATRSAPRRRPTRATRRSDAAEGGAFNHFSIASSQYSSPTLYPVSDHVQSLFFSNITIGSITAARAQVGGVAEELEIRFFRTQLARRHL